MNSSAPDEDRLTIARIIYLRHRSGESFREIALFLEKNNYRPKRSGQWNASSVRDIFYRTDSEQKAAVTGPVVITGGVARSFYGKIAGWQVDIGWVAVKDATVFPDVDSALDVAPEVPGIVIQSIENIQAGSLRAPSPSLERCPQDVIETLGMIPTDWRQNCLLKDAVVRRDWGLIRNYCRIVFGTVYPKKLPNLSRKGYRRKSA